MRGSLGLVVNPPRTCIDGCMSVCTCASVSMRACAGVCMCLYKLVCTVHMCMWMFLTPLPPWRTPSPSLSSGPASSWSHLAGSIQCLARPGSPTICPGEDPVMRGGGHEGSLLLLHPRRPPRCQVGCRVGRVMSQFYKMHMLPRW